MSQDDHGMPILETEGAPIRVSSKPVGLITRFAEVAQKHKAMLAPITHNTSARSSDASDVPNLAGRDDDRGRIDVRRRGPEPRRGQTAMPGLHRAQPVVYAKKLPNF